MFVWTMESYMSNKLVSEGSIQGSLRCFCDSLAVSLVTVAQTVFMKKNFGWNTTLGILHVLIPSPHTD